jgi:pimeloyl-ACP methyl ester carboxylesterase
MATFIDVEQRPIAWREAGPSTAEPVLFLHGLGGSRIAWDPQLAALSARGLRCAAWDMPSYGASPPLTAPLTFDGLVDAVAAWMDALAVSSAHLVGLSMGGMVAQHVALRDPDRVRSLALLDTSPAFGLDGRTTAHDWMERRLRPLREGETPATIADATVRRIMAPGAGADAVEQAVAAMARIPSEALAAAVRCLVTHDVRADLSRLHLRTLVMVGELDAETPPSYAEALASSIDRARLEVIPGAGHISNLEAPDTVNQLLEAHLCG